MTEMLIAPNAASASTQLSGRSNESRANEAANADTEAGTPTPFAAVLRSRSETSPADSSKEKPSATETQQATDDTAPAAAPTAPIDPSALLSLLGVQSPLAARAAAATPIDPTALPSLQGVGSPLAAHSASTALVSAASPASKNETDALIVTASGLLPTPTAVPVSPTSAVSPKETSFAASPAPTFSVAESRETQKNIPGQAIGLSAGLGGERSTAPDKLAVDAAITAGSGTTGAVSTTHDSGDGDFRAVMERMANNPAAAVMQTAATSAPAAPTPGLRLETPLGQAGWRDEMGQKLTWMVSNNRHQAELVLNPPQLGRIEVTLTLDGDRASLNFVSPHAGVRETLESSMTRLREVLAEAGVTLGQTHVGADSRHDSSSMTPNNDGPAAGRKDDERYAGTIVAIGSGSAARSANGRGMVDVFV